MKPWFAPTLNLLLALVLALGATTGMARANDAGAVRVEHAWVRLLPGDLPASGYAVLRNTGDTPVALVAASSEASTQLMLHRSSTEGGMARMTMVERLAVPAHGQVALAPGGYHLMLMHARRPLKPGDTVKLRLQFADGSHLDADFLVRPANASS
jgi:copper(I)-binding protein